VTAEVEEAIGTPRPDGEWATGGHPNLPGSPAAPESPGPTPSSIDATRFAHASEAEMARILDFYQVRWEYEPTTFPILWNLDGEVVESFAPDFYLPDIELFLEMTTLRQRLVRKKNRKLRRLRELYPDIRIKLFYARDFRAMMLKYGRLGLAESLSGTPGQMVRDRPVAIEPIAAGEPRPAATTPGPAPVTGQPAALPEPRMLSRTRSGRRRHTAGSVAQAGAEREAGA